ncbi:SDR family NAD(P)-dependent oxidoreductase [Fluviispira sanaruensis]|uniref:Short chain dehydrogenase n=1 Tax=Fluviispira sanaruensis TaxID=2493639 RepID=A0A4P2VJ25_FLUSA|nr:SDR family NAD(P)-dependent oxidoreductase [Fluviispira sanaruensis]BBH53126.1 short chain dehydrogenase [Fluviispira sanaruensis]
MNSNFQKKYGPWALVTGASDGIGRALAIEIAKVGLNLIIVGRNNERLEKLGSEIQKKFNVIVKIIAIDLAKNESNKALISQINQYEIGLFAAIAGFGTSGDFFKGKIQDELEMIDVNCRSVVEQTYYFANRFVTQKRGGIILMGSLVGFQGVPYSANYAATKAFIQNFAEGLHFELKQFGVDVLSSAPGPVQSGFGKRANLNMGNAASTEVVAEKTIQALGYMVTIRPGFLSKFLGWSLIILPRIMRIYIMRIIMGKMAK